MGCVSLSLPGDFLPLLHPLDIYFQLTEGYLNLLTLNWPAYIIHNIVAMHTAFGVRSHK